MSTTGLEDGPPLCTGSQVGDTGTGIHMVAAILAALYQRTHSGQGQRVEVAMQDSVLNLVRVKMRDHHACNAGRCLSIPREPLAIQCPVRAMPQAADTREQHYAVSQADRTITSMWSFNRRSGSRLLRHGTGRSD